MKFYGDRRSGNCYKLVLTAALLAIEYEWCEIDILAGQARTREFLEKNPNGKIPLLELPDGRMLAESNAIINYLAAGSALLPTDTWQLAKVQQWQFFEQYTHEPTIAVARFIQTYEGLPEHRREEFGQKQLGGYRALDVMEQHLNARDFFVGDSPTVADISLFAYTHVAHEGGFDLDGYPAIRAWLERVETQDRFEAMVTG